MFFFRRKTAYEMRISDWSSDVCSSDLIERPFAPRDHRIESLDRRRDADIDESRQPGAGDIGARHLSVVRIDFERDDAAALDQPARQLDRRIAAARADFEDACRSEERRVGKECGRPGRSRWWPLH